MRLVLRDNKAKDITAMDEDFRTLAFYGVVSDHIIYVIDLNPNSIHKMIEDLSSVEKFQISEADYDKLPDNFRKWKQ
jgi:Ubiquitin-like domain